MKKNRGFLWASLFCVGFFSGQEVKRIDTVNIKKSVIEHQYKVKSELGKKDLEKSFGDNFANVLKNISGVTLLQSGANISKPVIQGVTNQRILMLNNGIKIESQQWGNDHAPEIDPFLAQSIEIVKGSEAVKYGANAMGGVVLLKSENLPYFGRVVGGKAQLVGESNTEKWAGNIMLQGNISRENAFAWRIQSSAKKAGNYRTADYYVDNTGARELNYSANVGYKMPKEKVELFYSYFSTELGVYTGSRIGSQEDWQLRILEGRPLDRGYFSYEINLPRQEVNHHLAKINIESQRAFGKLNVQYAFQRNHRQEYDRRRGTFANKPTFDMELTTHSFLLDLEKAHHHYFKFFVGANYAHQENQNVIGNGINPVLPNFISDNVGVYLSEEFQRNSWTLSAGLRYDYKLFDAAGYNRSGQYYSGQRAFGNLSYNLGIYKKIGKYVSLVSNIGMAWRAPEAIELYSNGVHHGSAFYVQGDEHLDLERGLKWSSKIQFSNERLWLSADVFLQKIKGYIYEMPTRNYINTWAGAFPIFVYKQSDALFRGVDLSVKYSVLSWLDYELKASVVHASNLTENYYFPHISPENLSQKFNFRLAFLKPLRDSYVGVEHSWANKQKRFSPETDLIPFTPSAYHLFNLAMGTNVPIYKDRIVNFSFMISNVFNHLYKDYTDRFRYFAHGMGRNFQFRINYNF